MLDCRDKSDEKNCYLVQFDVGYNRDIAPFRIEKGSKTVIPVEVKVSMTLENVLEISEVNHIITLKFAISLNWYENRVQYYNLKEKSALNALSQGELGQLWIPYIIFKNTDEDEALTVDAAPSTVAVTREGGFTYSDPSVVDEIAIFKGIENRITMNQTHSKKFHCTYQLHYFPFDTQVNKVTRTSKRAEFVRNKIHH